MPRSRARRLSLNNAVVDTVENAEWAKARGDFAVYRKVIRREMLWDWWPQEVSEKLQQFYQDLKDGKRPKVAIMAPPQGLASNGRPRGIDQYAPGQRRRRQRKGAILGSRVEQKRQQRYRATFVGHSPAQTERTFFRSLPG
jgi:hypothetical protein